MDTVTLGRSGLVVSVAGLGCGGHSRLGQATGASFGDSVKLVRRALDLGVNYIDTAAAYGTEEVVGAALNGDRDRIVLSTKALPRSGDSQLSAAGLRASLESSLRRLRTDYVDVFHLHGVTEALYGHCVAELLPELARLRDEGRIRLIAISEHFVEDPGHVLLEHALGDGYWDVAMVGFNLLNPSARRRVLPTAMAHGVGVEVMFAVRRALSHRDELRKVVRSLVEEGRVAPKALDPEDPLSFLVREGGATSVVEAAYRFARHEPGCHVILTGTGNVAHLEQNVASINKGTLPDEHLQRLEELFGQLDDLSGN